MNFAELRQAVSGAFRQRDYAQFKALTDEFLAAAQGDEYCRALCLKADWCLMVDIEHAAQGFVFIGEALLLARSPGARLSALTGALALCYHCSDLERARPYEEESCRLLLEHGTLPDVRARRHRLQLNLGQMAYLRGDYATAYWHFAQAAESLSSPAVPEAERRGLESPIQSNIATACLRVRRYYEAQEALDLAEQRASTEIQRQRALVWRCELLRQLGQIEEAQQILKQLALTVPSCVSPDVRSRYYWFAALVAQDAGDLSGFHQFLVMARDEAAEHRLDYLLSEIQRFQRSPL